MNVPFFRPALDDAEIEEVVAVLRSGWLTTGPRVARFEREFAEAVGATHAVAVNSCTAALHLALEALGVRRGDGVLVPTMTFAATANVVCHLGATPILVDCDPATSHMRLADAEWMIDTVRSGRLPGVSPDTRIVGIVPVHTGGLMMNVDAVRTLAARHGFWIVDDAAHAFPAAWRRDEHQPWQRCGEGTADVTCFSFYANKTITTGEGGMAVTNTRLLADRIRQMSLHGLSQTAWGRYASGGSWDYAIEAPGYKYNLTDVAAAIGLHQLAKAELMRRRREEIAADYRRLLADVDELAVPPAPPHRIHAWHLFPIRLRLDSLTINRNEFLEALKQSGVGCSVHWRPLHLHPFYRNTFGYRREQYPNATATFAETISLPLFPTMTPADVRRVADAVRHVVAANRHAAVATAAL